VSLFAVLKIPCSQAETSLFAASSLALLNGEAPFSTLRAASLISEYMERFTLHFDVFSRFIETTTKFNRRIAAANLRSRANQLTKAGAPEVRKKVSAARD
jgi:hypothetical protein